MLFEVIPSCLGERDRGNFADSASAFLDCSSLMILGGEAKWSSIRANGCDADGNNLRSDRIVARDGQTQRASILQKEPGWV